MYLVKAVGGWSVTRIGKFYNGRHHTTVCYAIRRVATLRAVHAGRWLIEVSGRGDQVEADKGLPTTNSCRGTTDVKRMTVADRGRVYGRFVDRLITRLRPSIVEALAARIPQR